MEQTKTIDLRATPAPQAGKTGSRLQGKLKIEQLITHLSRPKGIRISKLCEALNWQKHSVRAALTGLRNKGFEITHRRSTQNGEAIYTIASKPSEDLVK